MGLLLTTEVVREMLVQPVDGRKVSKSRLDSVVSTETEMLPMHLHSYSNSLAVTELNTLTGTTLRLINVIDFTDGMKSIWMSRVNIVFFYFSGGGGWVGSQAETTTLNFHSVQNEIEI